MAITVDCNTPPGGVVGQPYSHFFTSDNPGALFYILPGILPSGLTLNGVTGEVSGIPDTIGWTPAELSVGHQSEPLTVNAFNTGTLERATMVCGMATYLNCLPLTPDCDDPPGGTIGIAYSHSLIVAAGGIAPFTFAITAGSLPAGLTMSGGGVITGTPTTNGTSSFTVEVTGSGDPLNNIASMHCQISIGGTSPHDSPQLYFYSFGFIGPLGVDCGVSEPGVDGVAYQHLIPIVPGGTAPYVFGISAGALPDGLTIDPDTGIISGTPTVVGVFNFTVEVVDADLVTVTVDCSIEIFEFPEITCDNPPDGAEGVPYNHTFPVTGGVPPYTFTVIAGTIPGGLTLDPDTGQITGTPNTPGVFDFTVQVADSYTVLGAPTPNVADVDCSITITGGGGGALEITCDNPPDGTVGVAYNHTLPVSGGTPPYSFALTAGSLPTGLTLGASSGLISGTPTVGGTFTFTVEVTDDDANTASVECSITIVGVSGLEVLCDDPPAGKVGISYSHLFVADGGTAPYVFSIIDGALPPGLSLDASTGEVSGTPTLSGFYEFTILVTDADDDMAQAVCSITVKTCQLVDLG